MTKEIKDSSGEQPSLSCKKAREIGKRWGEEERLRKMVDDYLIYPEDKDPLEILSYLFQTNLWFVSAREDGKELIHELNEVKKFQEKAREHAHLALEIMKNKTTIRHD